MNSFWISIFFSIIQFVYILPTVHHIVVTVRLYGRIPFRDSILTLRYTLQTKNAWNVLSPALSILIFFVVLPLLQIGYPKIILLPIFILHLCTIALYGTPPSVLLLGSSRWETVRLFNLVERAIYPYRVVALLDESSIEPSRHSHSHWFHFKVDNLRILGSHNWRDVVFRISTNVPLIVLDTRFPSPAVVEETHRMLENQNRNKTVFVLSDDGSAPAVAAASPSVSLQELHTAEPCNVADLLKKLGLKETTSPDDNPVIEKISYVSNSKKIERAMMAVAKIGIPFRNSLDIANKEHGPSSFVTEARYLQKRLIGNPNDGALEVYAQLSRDIELSRAFIDSYRNTNLPEYRTVLHYAEAVYRELCNLQKTIDNAPPNFLLQNKARLKK